VERRLAVPYGDDEPLADEHEDLAELDDVVSLGEPRGLEDGEERLAVELELRALMGVDRVLDRELVEAELALCRLELGDRRVQEADPGEGPVRANRLVGVFDGQLAGDTASILVDGAVDDHAPIMAACPVSREGLRVESRTQEMHQVDDPFSTYGTANASPPATWARPFGARRRGADRAPHLRACR